LIFFPPGAIKIEIANKKGETISKLPGNAASSKRLLVELKIIWHEALQFRASLIRILQ
jgi:hypothetical protein